MKILFLTLTVLAYYKQGHQFIGELVDSVLVNSSLNTSIKEISPWADSIRRKKGYSWVAPLHYIDTRDDSEHNNCNPHIDTLDGNIYTALKNYTARISDKKTRTLEDLKFFVHFYQDLFQPLHMSGIYRGGNRYKVLFFGRKASLHEVWDYLILRNRIKERPDYKEYMLDIVNTISSHRPYDIEFWIKHNNKLTCDYVYSGIQKNEEISEEYYEDTKTVVEILIAMCVANLKKIIDDLYSSYDKLT